MYTCTIARSEPPHRLLTFVGFHTCPGFGGKYKTSLLLMEKDTRETKGDVISTLAGFMQIFADDPLWPVSYTHLTLPTKVNV